MRARRQRRVDRGADETAGAFAAHKPTPSPFSSTTSIGFDLPAALAGSAGSPPRTRTPRGDHTVGFVTNTIPESGGIALTATYPGVYQTDYTWEGWILTGNGNTRRGFVVRATPDNGFEAGYFQSGLFISTSASSSRARRRRSARGSRTRSPRASRR